MLTDLKAHEDACICRPSKIPYWEEKCRKCGALVPVGTRDTQENQCKIKPGQALPDPPSEPASASGRGAAKGKAKPKAARGKAKAKPKA